MGTLIPAMSLTFLVTTVISRTMAVAAISESMAGRFLPARSASPQMRPQASEISRSMYRMRSANKRTISSSHRSNRLALTSSPRLAIPFLISPIVNTERYSSLDCWRESHSTTCEFGVGFASSLMTQVSSRYFIKLLPCRSPWDHAKYQAFRLPPAWDTPSMPPRKNDLGSEAAVIVPDSPEGE